MRRKLFIKIKIDYYTSTELWRWSHNRQLCRSDSDRFCFKKDVKNTSFRKSHSHLWSEKRCL